MKIAQLIENDIEEARRGNWGREQSHATGQQLGKDIAAGLPAADQQAAIKTGQAQAAQGQAQADLRARLAKQKAQKVAEPVQQPAQAAAPQQSTAQPNLAQKVAGGIQKAGDIGSAVTGAVGNVGAGFFGGMKRGFNQQAYGTGPARPSGDAEMAAAKRSAPAPAAGGMGDEPDDHSLVQSLLSRVSNLERQLGTATAEGYQFESKYLGTWI